MAESRANPQGCAGGRAQQHPTRLMPSQPQSVVLRGEGLRHPAHTRLSAIPATVSWDQETRSAFGRATQACRHNAQPVQCSCTITGWWPCGRSPLRLLFSEYSSPKTRGLFGRFPRCRGGCPRGRGSPAKESLRPRDRVCPPRYWYTVSALAGFKHLCSEWRAKSINILRDRAWFCKDGRKTPRAARCRPNTRTPAS